MSLPVDVIVTGFTPSTALMEKSLAPLRQLHREGVVRGIHYVTWDSAEIDPYLAPLAGMPEVTLTRVPQPQAQGIPEQRGLVYQIENLAAGLRLLPQDDSLVLKWRPDFVARHAFLRDKVAEFETWSAVPENVCFGVAMPPRLFQSKVWIPWADSNSPFFFEDAAFFGMRRDIEKLVTPLTPADMAILDDVTCRWYVHVVRYAKIFVSRYPFLENYLKHFRLFPMDVEHRLKIVPYLADNGFGWHLLIANAWILHSQFHVDIGAPGDLSFYANAVNRDADWSRFDSLKVTFPYDDPTAWRDATRAGKVFPSVNRAFGRLMDDEWQKALFTTGVPDLPRDTLVALMANIARSRDGRLAQIEAEFYQGAERIYSTYRSVALTR
ncbi:MAG TPA: hypothetical protein VGC16_07330 [Rhizomicrobium sp.]